MVYSFYFYPHIKLLCLYKIHNCHTKRLSPNIVQENTLRLELVVLNIFAPCFQRNVKGEHEKVVDKVTLLHTSLDTVNTFAQLNRCVWN